MRYISIDYGQKKIGVAVSDITGLVARPLTTIFRDPIGEIVKIIKEYNAGAVVVGVAVNADGSLSEQGSQAIKFIEKLRNNVPNDVEIITQNETYSTRDAQKIMIQNYSKKKRRKKGLDDAIAAAVILQEFLNRQEKR